MPAALSILDFVDHEHLLGPHFEGPSWDRWRSVLKAAFALPMTERDRTLFAEVAGDRAPPTRPVRELACAVGRGGGKDSVASAIATHIAATGDFSRLRAGEKATVLLLACDRDQASIAFNYIRGYFETVPVLTRLLAGRISDDTITLTNGAQIIVGTNTLRAPRGRTFCCAIYDECAFYYSEDYANPDVEVDAAVSPGLMRFPGSMKILISSVNKRGGLLYDRYAEHFGRDGDDVLVVMGESLKFNPTLDQTLIDRELLRDPERAAAEYLCQWRDDLSTFLDRQLVMAAIERGVTARPPKPGVYYDAFADPSGGRGDAFTAAIAHEEDDGLVVLDALYERRAPFVPTEVVAEIAALLRSYGISAVTGDHYAADWVTDGFGGEWITYVQSERDKSKLYRDALPLFTSGRARLLDSERLVHQLTSLERRASRVGRDIVSHPNHANAHDDLANAACGALVSATTGDPGHWRAMAAHARRRREAALANGANGSATTLVDALTERERQRRAEEAERARATREADADARARREADVNAQLRRAVAGSRQTLFGRGIT
jgi:hypothetical protein